MKKDKYIGYLVGNKIGKSYSKDIYPSFMNVTYKQKDFKNFEDLEDFINNKEYDFINVTIPYKKDVITLLDEASREVEKTNACNLIVNEDGKLKGYNTDCYGFTCLVDINKIDLKGKNILILGNGATSRTVKYDLSIATNAPNLVDVACRKKKCDSEILFQDIEDKYEIIINTTPVGKHPNDPKLINMSKLKRLECFIDINYTPFRTNFLIEAKNRGLGHIGGLDMLVYQALKTVYIVTKNKDISVEQIASLEFKLRMENTNIYFVGLPTSGKTKIIKTLRKKYGNDFVLDTDEMIEKENKKSIAKIFEEEGEESFRGEEMLVAEMLKTLRGGRIISTGGGFFTENMLNYYSLVRRGLFVYLKKSNFDDYKDDGKRPLVHSKEDLIDLYKKRHDIYDRMADITVDSSMDVDDLMREVCDALIMC